MNILIVDKAEIAAQLIKVKFEKLGYDTVYEPSKEKALKLLNETYFDMVLVDPAPLTDANQIVMDMRRASAKYNYIALLSSDYTQEEAIASGANEAIAKPADQEKVIQNTESANRLTKLIDRISDKSEDFPNAGGIISKSAFNELFTSAFERGSRYGERSYVMFVSLTNYEDLVKENSAYAANLMVAEFSKTLSSIRRQSDIVAQTSACEYAVLLQRPRKIDEPQKAAKRFADTLQKMLGYDSKMSEAGQMRISLIELPTGHEVISYEWDIEPKEHKATQAVK